uniref:RNA helicase n=1 Tax=Chromera velia CCMP2878 TaxID=1169474 RepID=A0A0G4I0Q8_9ALVE|eukprot:Cvel_34488.t1-p1 / transcript=Cvel_34488.t1 / gene=Cvel_34488 / organism=Chromera_velia_CCMP2878 / gene_product=ATP-dependent RNA helicase ded1, putative / transcript_product=ATP-dependent RNA helicase ded1, putative / location=Cvel_scaffold5942:96-3736(-) / protein_length=405 / sequence_SO=supercontig / SO=protein_coding / is_pseudo=false
MSTGINFDSYDAIPVEVSARDVKNLKDLKIETFQDAEVHELIADNVKRLKYQRPTPVQKNAIPIILGEHDLMGCAQTGSGKTAAFLVPVIAQMLRRGPPGSMSSGGAPYSSRRKAFPVALVLAPTRELAGQIFDEAKKWSFGTGIRPVVIYGGAQAGLQLRELEYGCDVLVACPGRLLDFVGRGRVSLDQIQFLVFDEADRMLDMGFEPQIREVVDGFGMPSKGDRQTVMFSATFPREIQNLARDFMVPNYVFLTVGRVGSTHEYIKQRLMYCEEGDKQFLLRKMCDEQQEDGLILVFVETKRKADELEHYMNKYDYPACAIHGDMKQPEREEALRLFKKGRCPILVATDVAQRGLDIPNVKQVINYDLPNNIDDYVHRSVTRRRASEGGETRRMDYAGDSIVAG